MKDKMSEVKSEDRTYHDYVIKDGEFIGDFENLYRDIDDPWRQSSQPNKYARIAGITHLKNFQIKSVLECGSGLGYYANWIHKETGIAPLGIDISKEAIVKAQKLFPNLRFRVSDVTTDLLKYKQFDCILFSEIVWYILPDLNSIFELLTKEFKGKYLLVNQVFYKGTQQYGNEFFTNLSEFIEYVPFTLLGASESTMSEDITIETSSIYRID
ncbi:MAG: nodulation protein S NodS [Crocinitomicaceae bacterium]|nr:nodulation protein S NodS [Crocinitomicaceae bacterium]|tara:strand:+ start:12698 stop:13336 length:639 start_codon:yes stop_codon:yes gene_type:complete